jgi:uncharacterized membrane protein
MVAANFNEQTLCGQIVLKPNRSWTWRANTYFVASLMVVSLTVATVFTINGMWVILPFTVLELSVLTACLYYCVRRTHTTEVLTLSQSTLVLERGVNRPTQRFDFDRYFSRFLVEAARHPWYKKRINLRCRNQQLEVGSFLSNEEKDDLISQLRTMILRLDQTWTAP